MTKLKRNRDIRASYSNINPQVKLREYHITHNIAFYSFKTYTSYPQLFYFGRANFRNQLDYRDFEEGD